MRHGLFRVMMLCIISMQMIFASAYQPRITSPNPELQCWKISAAISPETPGITPESSPEMHPVSTSSCASPFKLSSRNRIIARYLEDIRRKTTQDALGTRKNSEDFSVCSSCGSPRRAHTIGSFQSCEDLNHGWQCHHNDHPETKSPTPLNRHDHGDHTPSPLNPQK